jgi:hypothetical protein
MRELPAVALHRLSAGGWARASRTDHAASPARASLTGSAVSGEWTRSSFGRVERRLVEASGGPDDAGPPDSNPSRRVPTSPPSEGVGRSPGVLAEGPVRGIGSEELVGSMVTRVRRSPAASDEERPTEAHVNASAAVRRLFPRLSTLCADLPAASLRGVRGCASVSEAPAKGVGPVGRRTGRRAGDGSCRAITRRTIGSASDATLAQVRLQALGAPA